MSKQKKRNSNKETTLTRTFPKDDEFLLILKKKMGFSSRAVVLQRLIRAFKKHLSLEELK